MPNHQMKPCPFCGQSIPASSFRCMYCHSVVSGHLSGIDATPPVPNPENHENTELVVNGTNQTYARPPQLNSKPHRNNSGMWIFGSACAAIVVGVLIFTFIYTNRMTQKHGYDRDYNIEGDYAESKQKSQTEVVDTRSSRTDDTKETSAAVMPHRANINPVSLLSMVNRNDLIEGLVEYDLGSSFPSSYTYGDYYNNTRMGGYGYLGENNVTVDFFLEPNGEIHGRYTNENGTRLDMNGYVDAYGDLYIQLGHNSEKSYWNLTHDRTNPGVYSGRWGKKGKPTEMTFYVY